MASKFSKAVADTLANAARAGQTLMREAFGLDVKPTGHWGSYSQKLFAQLPAEKKAAVTKIVSAYNADLATIAEIANEATATAKAPNPGSGGQGNAALYSKRFKEEVVPAVLRIGKSMGFVKPELAAAQLAHESAFGSRPSGSFNYGGIKATSKEPGVLLPTTEYVKGVAVRVNAKFKNYANADEFVKDYLNALVRKWPQTMRAKDGNEYASALIVNPKMMYFTDDPGRYASAVNRALGQLA